jgi:hypothetical protein
MPGPCPAPPTGPADSFGPQTPPAKIDRQVPLAARACIGMQWVEKGRAHMGRAMDIREFANTSTFPVRMRQKASRTATFSSPRTRFRSARVLTGLYWAF